MPSCRAIGRSLLPIVCWLPNYDVQKLRQDAIAGITVGLMVIPQGLAYAQIANLPVQFGLYSAFMGPFVYCLLGTSKDTTLGPTAIMSLITATYNLAPGPAPKSPTYAVLMCLACGVVQFALGAVRLGAIVNFISLPVVGGFTTSAAVTIAWGQVKSLLGLKNISNSLPISLYEILRDIRLTNYWDLIVGICCMAALLILMKFQRDITASSIGDRDTSSDDGALGESATAAAAAAAASGSCCVTVSRLFIKIVCSGRNALVVAAAGLIAFSLKRLNLSPLSLTPRVAPGLPPFKPPDFELSNGTHVERDFWEIASDIGIGFAVIPFVGLVETIAITRVFARQGNYRIDPSQELIAIGLSNVAGSFVSSFPVTGSFSRTAINYQSGVRTPAGGIFTGGIVLLALALLGDLFQFIPQAALAAVIIVAVLQMTDFRMLVKLWFISKTDFAEWIVTFVFSILLGVEYGIVLGIAASFAFLLYQYSSPGYQKTTRPSGLAVLTLQSGVRFPAVESLQQSVISLAAASVSAASSAARGGVCVDLSRVTGIDFAVVDALLTVQQSLRLLNKGLYIVASSPQVSATLHQARLPVYQSLDSLENELSVSCGATEITPLIL